MADTPAKTTPAPAPEPEPESGPDDVVDLLPSGAINIVIAGIRYRLRPLKDMGMLKRFRLALEDVTDRIDEASRAAEDIADEVEEALKDASNLSPEDQRKLRPKHRELRDRAKAASRHMVDVADEARADWWRDVLATLATDDTGRPCAPDELPAWMVDINLPGKVMAHWRSAPLGRGK